MKVAIVQDELVRKGGAEQVVRYFSMAFPDAPIFTSAYQPEGTFEYFKKCDIRPSWFQIFAKNEKQLKRFFFPFGVIAMKQLDVTGYDVVLMSSTQCAKYVKVSKHSLVINYCHTPFRLAWRPESYAEYTSAGFVKKILYNTVIGILRSVDFNAAQRTDIFLTNAAEVKNRIATNYKTTKPIEVINPPVDCSQFNVSDGPKEYYLVVSRFEFYKRVDLVIEAFNTLGLPLIIVGKGSKEKELKEMAGKNITFMSNVSEADLGNLYSNCKALIFPQLEDYGITPLEAASAGRPVIAYGEGGVLETMVPYTDDAKKATAVFFKEQTVSSVIDAVKVFEGLEFDQHFIRAHAEKYDKFVFIQKIKDFVTVNFNKHKKILT